MRVVLLNWKGGDNDPFSVVNATLQRYLENYGKTPVVLEISEPGWEQALRSHLSAGIDFVYTWQGIGSGLIDQASGKNLWEALRVPLICLHGDHPSHMPSNHAAESRYCRHLYANAAFSRYSNTHFRSAQPASKIDIPLLYHDEVCLETFSGRYFVMLKNIVDPQSFIANWKSGFHEVTYGLQMQAATLVGERLTSSDYVEPHDVLDEVLQASGIALASVPRDLFHFMHSQIDMYTRNLRTERAVREMHDLPVEIHGAGWDYLAERLGPHQRFQAGRNMADSRPLYYSEYGLVDISPSEGLHDRTRRALKNACGFLSSAYLSEVIPAFEDFEGLFYSFRPGVLRARCEAVLSDPLAHRAVSADLSRHYQQTFHYSDFLWKLQGCADQMRGTG